MSYCLMSRDLHTEWEAGLLEWTDDNGVGRHLRHLQNYYPLVHALITDTCWDREGNVLPMPDMDPFDIHGVEKLFAGLVFRMLLEEGMISEELVENMNSWKNSGFRVY